MYELTGGRPVSEVIFSAEDIRTRVGELGREIAEHYGPDSDLLLLGLLKGSFIFLADLVRNIPQPHKVDFLVASSYGSGTKSSGNVRLVFDPETDVAGKDVLLIEDIVDSGNTVSRLIELLTPRHPRSLEICTLLHKRIAKRLEREPKFVGFDAPQKFLVGYGLDHAEEFRHLPSIVALEE